MSVDGEFVLVVETHGTRLNDIVGQVRLTINNSPAIKY
jgi:hypothetical protein